MRPHGARHPIALEVIPRSEAEAEWRRGVQGAEHVADASAKLAIVLEVEDLLFVALCSHEADPLVGLARLRAQRRRNRLASQLRW
jgi:hypothetical protein